MPAKNRRSVLLGEALRRARTAAGVTQENLAFEAKLDRTYISHLENGHKSPTVDVLFRICPVLRIAASQLIAQVERSLESRRK
jgi:transcriptional regulator with XRE-family HTH domain